MVKWMYQIHYVEHKHIHKQACVCSDGKTWTQINHILIDPKGCRHIHGRYFVRAKPKQSISTLSNKTNPTNQQPNTEKQKYEKTKLLYELAHASRIRCDELSTVEER